MANQNSYVTTPGRFVAAIAAMLTLAASSCSNSSDGGSAAACANDTECKGNRICVSGSCVDPAAGGSGGGGAGQGGNVTGGAGGAGATASGGAGGSTPQQSYGRCHRTCSSTPDCCPEGCTTGSNDYVCEGGFCKSSCKPSCAKDVAGFKFACSKILMGPPGESTCSLVCDGNDCSQAGPAPEFYCNPHQGYEPKICGYDCRVKDVCGTGVSNRACLSNGDCGCVSDSDCEAGSKCFKQWAPF